MNIQFEDNYVVIEEPSFCLAVPVTPSGKVVMVRQRRRGAKKECLEFPAGMIDDGQVYACAKRELTEETGYASINERCTESPVTNDNWAIHKERSIDCTGQAHYLGYVFAEPARNRQRGYGFLFQVAEDATEAVELDQEERDYKKTRVVKVPVDDVQRLIDVGEIIHAGHIAMFERAMYHLKQDQKTHLER